MHMTVSVAVAGASGYAGGEVLRLLLGHPDVEIGALTAGSNAGERLGALQPHLLPLADRVLVRDDGRDAGRPRRGLPRPPARPVGRDRRGAGRRHRGHRLRRRLPAHRRRRQWETFYGGEHAGSWPYGLPELAGQRDLLRGARRIAVPGCYPTVSTLAIAPALAAGLVEPDVTVVAASGTSGAGKAAKPHLLGSEVDGQRQRLRRRRRPPPHPRDRPEPRAVHDGQVRVELHAAAGADVARHPGHGLGAARSASVTAEQARDAYAAAYADEPFVHLLPEGQWPQTKSVLGSNAVHVQVTVDEAAGRLVAVGRRRQPRQGHRRRRRAVHEPRPRPRRDHRPLHDRTRTMTDRPPPRPAHDAASSSPRSSPSSVSAPARRSRRGPSPPSIFSITATAPRPAGLRDPRRADQDAVHQGPLTGFEVQGPARPRARRGPAGLLGPLAEEQIQVFTLSTFDTDWILVPARGRRDRRPRPGDDRAHVPSPSRQAHRAPARKQARHDRHPSRGFTAAGVAAGLKTTGAKDLALVVNQGPTFDSASVFTANRCKANPILWSQEVVKDGTVRAVVLNSGGANCYTGPDGFQTTHAVAEKVAERARHRRHRRRRLLDRPDRPGQRPRRPARRRRAPPRPRCRPTGEPQAAEAIMTTDSVSKQVVVEGAGWSIGGMAKGAGMLAPALATMLVVITTDAVVPAAELDAALRAATRVSFDRLDSDGCMSTNDTVTVMASGASGITPTPEDFTAALTQACTDLAMQLLKDAEGADHEIAITTLHAATEDEAVEVEPQRRPQQPLQGRRLRQRPQLGPRARQHRHHVRPQFDPADLDVAMNGVWVCRSSTPAEDPAGVDLTGREVSVTIDLKSGDARATVWTNDLTHAYVHENSAYSS